LRLISDARNATNGLDSQLLPFMRLGELVGRHGGSLDVKLTIQGRGDASPLQGPLQRYSGAHPRLRGWTEHDDSQRRGFDYIPHWYSFDTPHAQIPTGGVEGTQGGRRSRKASDSLRSGNIAPGPGANLTKTRYSQHAWFDPYYPPVIQSQNTLSSLPST
jgi:hypothetical protein